MPGEYVNVDPPFSPALGDTGAVLSLLANAPGEVPHHRCTAVLIEPQRALTAAHCVTPPPKEVAKDKKDKAATKCPVKDGVAPYTWGLDPGVAGPVESLPTRATARPRTSRQPN